MSSDNLENQKEQQIPENVIGYADDVFTGSNIDPLEFNKKLIDLERACLEQKPENLYAEALIIKSIFNDADELSLLACLMNRNAQIATMRFHEAQVNLQQSSMMIDQIMNRAKAASNSNIILPGQF